MREEDDQIISISYQHQKHITMDYFSENRVGKLFILLLLLIAGLVLHISFSRHTLSPLNFYQQCGSSNMSTVANYVARDELDMALEGAAMENKTLIIAMVNKAYVEQGEKTVSMLDLFLESFWLGGNNTRPLLHHLLLVTVDEVSYERCIFLRLHCYRLVNEGVDFGAEKLYMSDEFIKMMWRRTLFLADVLKRGYNFIFTDTDIMWLNNPFTRLSHDGSEDIQISCDNFNGDPWSGTNPMNTGFYFVRSNNKTIATTKK